MQDASDLVNTSGGKMIGHAGKELAVAKSGILVVVEAIKNSFTGVLALA